MSVNNDKQLSEKSQLWTVPVPVTATIGNTLLTNYLDTSIVVYLLVFCTHKIVINGMTWFPMRLQDLF